MREFIKPTQIVLAIRPIVAWESVAALGTGSGLGYPVLRSHDLNCSWLAAAKGPDAQDPWSPFIPNFD